MKIKYIGRKKDFKLPVGKLVPEACDFSKGPVEVLDTVGQRLIAIAPHSFKEVVAEGKKSVDMTDNSDKVTKSKVAKPKAIKPKAVKK